VIIKAAGRTLTVGELRGVLADLDDNAEVLAHEKLIMCAEAGAASLELDCDVAVEEDVVINLVDEILDARTLKEAKTAAREAAQAIDYTPPV
jgi:hypothetical protein